jgi:hypothetical protein
VGVGKRRRLGPDRHIDRNPCSTLELRGHGLARGKMFEVKKRSENCHGL